MTLSGVESIEVPVGKGWLHTTYLPAPSPLAGLLLMPPFLHEWQRSYRLFALLSGALAQRGVSVLRFDYRGCGDSSGQDEDFLPSRALDDAEHALSALTARCPAPITVMGVRAGALLAERVAERRGQPWAAWQPVENGAAEWNELRRRDHAERNNRRRFPFLRGQVQDDPGTLMGHRIHPELGIELSIFKLTTAPVFRLDTPENCTEADLALPIECSRWVGQLDLAGSLPLDAVTSVAKTIAARLGVPSEVFG